MVRICHILIYAWYSFGTQYVCISYAQVVRMVLKWYAIDTQMVRRWYAVLTQLECICYALIYAFYHNLYAVGTRKLRVCHASGTHLVRIRLKSAMLRIVLKWYADGTHIWYAYALQIE